MKVDVLVVTYNSARTLDACLRCIEGEVPYNRVLVGDGGSRDGTVEVARRHGAEVYTFAGRNNMIGRIRYRLAELAETPWVVYVDSDVYLKRGWWRVMRRLARPSVGMAMAAAEPARADPLERYHRWRVRRFGFVTFGNTLCPRDLVLECRQLLDMHVGEDAAYARFCRAGGYRVLALPYPLVVHDKDEEGIRLAYHRWGRDMRARGDLLHFLLRAQIHLRNTMWFALEKGVTAQELSKLLALYWEMYRGYLGVA